MKRLLVLALAVCLTLGCAPDRHLTKPEYKFKLGEVAVLKVNDRKCVIIYECWESTSYKIRYADDLNQLHDMWVSWIELKKDTKPEQPRKGRF